MFVRPAFMHMTFYLQNDNCKLLYKVDKSELEKPKIKKWLKMIILFVIIVTPPNYM